MGLHSTSQTGVKRIGTAALLGQAHADPVKGILDCRQAALLLDGGGKLLPDIPFRMQQCRLKARQAQT